MTRLTIPATGPDFIDAVRIADAKIAARQAALAPPPTPEQRSESDRPIRMRSLSSIKSRVPTWIWEYDGVGRIQLGTLTMFAGKPASGKSTAVRWFAARLSQGDLPGIWYGVPMKVAVIMAEEQVDAIVKPGIVAAGGNTANIYYPEIKIGDIDSSIMPQADEAALTELLWDNEIRAVFVDPIMSTFQSGSDAYRNNEVRAHLAPWVRIAQAINGIVIGVTHLRKGEVRDVLDAVTGSSAFGEVPRAIFGFAPIPYSGGSHILQQVKNSAGPSGLRLKYRLPVERFYADDYQAIDLPRFEITGPTATTIEDIARQESDSSTTSVEVACEWLQGYLAAAGGTVPSAEVKRDAKIYGDLSEWALKTAVKRLGVVVETRFVVPEHHRTTVWRLPW